MLAVFDAIAHAAGGGVYNLSDADKEVAKELTRRAGRPIAVYLCTATLIKRYKPGMREPEKEWTKDPPSRMKKYFQ